MQEDLVVVPPTLVRMDHSPRFNVVIAYEDFETGKNAKKTYDFLVENLGCDCQFANQMWKFDILKIPKLQQIATNDACDADMIFISCHGGQELPAHVNKWIESWLSQGCSALALVALFDCDPEESYGIRTYLARVASRGGMELFAQPDEWPGTEVTLRHPSENRVNGHDQVSTGITFNPCIIPETTSHRWQLKN